ncbi:hypothetical protein QBC46DRAFT_392898 [Diplogelasinospora grovesii]|uniref:Uncharacterized protein n=1 Tax=Diplogelasinospora grovesii TaxID=303347 RepID=A0AAN6N2U6_9PEZI|nr:hypothetical protein QBC46DRAFT_392898 [Diplogelasinospora grovesii]
MAENISTGQVFEIPELLYHTTLTVIDYRADASGAIRPVYVLATHTNLETAKKYAATRALPDLGYEPDDFVEYAVRPHTGEDWPHGDGVIVYAKAPAGQVFLVGLDTKPNTESLPAKPDGSDTLQLPDGCDHLHYVLQTIIDYNRDRSGAIQKTEIEGCYVHRKDAFKAAKEVLLAGELEKKDFDQYDERDEELPEDWPFGDDVVVHAVAPTGENYSVAVRTIPGAHEKHHKRRAGHSENREVQH